MKGMLCLQGILFASAGRRGFGLQTSWGHGFMLAHIHMGEGKSCWSGPCYAYISGNLHVGMGEDLLLSFPLFQEVDHHFWACWENG